MVLQFEIVLPPFKRGYHIITPIVEHNLPELPHIGIFSLFIHHTSAALTINENADPSVRYDFESFFSKLVPENLPYIKHTLEGADDLPAHVKSSIIGTSISIPIFNNKLKLGTWQGIYLCEFRDYGGSRTLTGTILG